MSGQGKDLILSVSADGLSNGTPTPIENQGDLVINGGKTVGITVYKNGQNANHADAGKTITLSMGLTAPIGAGQELLLALDESEVSSFFWITNATTGGIEYTFEAKCAIASIAAPVAGDNNTSISLGIVGDWTRGAAS